jgi:hypothetical protein
VASGGPYNRADIRTVNIGGFGPAGGGGAATSFNLPLNDLGNGIVNLVPAQSSGSPTPTFTRASIASTKLASGLWGQVAIGIARSTYFGFDTAVGAYRGYWGEPAGTQLIASTAAIRDMTDASWVKVGITAAKTATGIDGVPNSATTLTATAPGGTILQTLIAAATSRTYCVFLRRVSGSGTIVIQQGATTLDVTAQLNSVTSTRVQLNASILNAAFGILMGSIGDVIEADANQFEPGAWASSPMLSAGAARAADIFNFPSAGNVGAPAFTVYTEAAFDAPAASISNECLVTLSAGAVFGAGNGALLRASNSTSITAGGNATSVAATYVLNAGINKFAGAFNTAGTIEAAVGNGGAVASNATLDWTGVGTTKINIGSLTSGGAQMHSGTQRNIRIFPSQLTNAQMQALTT